MYKYDQAKNEAIFTCAIYGLGIISWVNCGRNLAWPGDYGENPRGK